MKKFCLTFSFIILVATISNAQADFKALVKDFQKAAGSWKGSLTYLDYSTGKPYTMPAEIEIKRLNSSNQFILLNVYPNERSANSTDTVTISTDGKYIDKGLVKSRRKLRGGDIEIITEESGKDGNDNKAATFRHTYIVGRSIFKKRKEVQFTGEREWIKRHEYAYKR